MLLQTPSPKRSSLPTGRVSAPAGDDGPLTEGREFVWSDADFSRIKALIYKKAGISLHDGKHAMVYSRVSRRLRETGHASFKDYIDWLERHDGAEWQEFINALTTNLTAFFRESHHFDALAQLLRAKPTHAWRIWCAAASSGQEPYSVAMLLRELAERYVSETEAYDRTVCTGPVIRGAIMPATHQQRAQISRHADDLFYHLVALGNGCFTSDDLSREISRVERFPA